MPRLDALSEIQRQTLLQFPCMEHADAPVTALRRPLARSRLALVTTAGLHVRGDTPFEHSASGDQSFRVIPSSTAAVDILQSHTSIGFDHSGFYRDANISFPIDRLRELAERGAVGSITTNHYSFVGAQRDPRRIMADTGPEVARRLKADGVDAVLLTPT